MSRWVGIAAITVYAPTIFAEAGYSARKSQWMSGLNDVRIGLSSNIVSRSHLTLSSVLQITYMLRTLMAVVTIDRWGRRIGLYWGAVGQGIALILAGAFARLLKDNPEKAAQYGGAAAFFVFLYTAVFGATWLTIPWVRLTQIRIAIGQVFDSDVLLGALSQVYPTETFPLEVRAKGNAFGVVGWSIGNGYGLPRGLSNAIC